MLGHFDEQTMRAMFKDEKSDYDTLVKKTVEYKDRSEYRVMRFLIETMPDLKKQGIVVTSSMMQQVRDNWKRNGEPVDFSKMLANPSDIASLLRSTGATSFGALDQYETLDEGIRAKWTEYGNEYNRQMKNGVYLHAITDPEIRANLVSNDSGTRLSKALFVHRGKSLRELNPGEPVELYDKTNRTLAFNGKIRGQAQTQTQERAGFNQLPVGSQNQAGTQTTQNTAPQNEQTPVQNQDAVTDEQLLGWAGGTLDGRDYRGLSHVMGAYFTKADAEEIAKNFDSNQLLDAAVAHNGVELLRHMRSNGYDFRVGRSDKRNQIDVRLQSGENINVRIFDAEKNGAYIGRVYDSFNVYNYTVQGTKQTQDTTKFSAGDAIALVDYVMGNNPGKVFKAGSTPNSKVEIQGVSKLKTVQVAPSQRGNRYRATSFKDAEEARAYIETGIADSNAFVQEEFKSDELQALIDEGIDNEIITTPEFQARLEELYSNDVMIREAQERVAQMAYHSSDDNGYLVSVRDAIVGDYENGFNPAFVAEHMKDSGRGNERDAMMAALKVAAYDVDKIKGNEFAVNTMKEKIIAFDPETAKTIDEIEHPMLKRALEMVRDTLKSGQVIGLDGEKSDPVVQIDENGIIRWEGNRKTQAKKNDKGQMWQQVSGEIGQVMVPDEHGIIKTKFQGENNYGIVPGYTGYFSFEGDYDDRMKRFRVKGFEENLGEQLRSKVTHQLTRPIDKATGNIPTVLDASGLNGLYHGDVYGKRIELDFMETNQLNDETKRAILKTLSSRVRFDNQYSDYATTSAETAANRELGQGDDTSAFSYWKAAGETNMRVLDKDIENYADTTMTGTGKTQGLIWYLADGAEINPDGSVSPSKGILQADGTYAPDKTALQKLPYFDKKDHNAWDRNQMSSNQLMTALKVDEGVGTALMAFGGWTFDDSYAVSKDFAERNKVFGHNPNEESMRQLDEVLHYMSTNENTTKDEVLAGTGMMWSDEVINKGLALRDATLSENRAEREAARATYQDYLEEHGRFRPLQRGDKLSDFGGNKGTIGIVIDRDMDPAEAKKQKLEKEVAFLKANPELDVISAPYSMLSRHNAGVVKELMQDPKDLVNPETGEVLKAAMGRLNIIVTDMKVDDKTHAYSREDVLEGKGRKASGQLAWALQSKGASGILNEIYGRNDSAWATYREYLIATGLDMKPDGTIVHGYTPHADEQRHHFAFDESMDSVGFLESIKDKGGFLDIPFDVKFKNGQSTDVIPVLSASLRQNVELVDGSMRRSDFTNHYANIYDAVGEYERAETDEAKNKAKKAVQESFDQIQSTIIDRQFNGGHNGKHSFLRDKIMGKRMQHSATGVAIVDPRLDIGQAGMNQDMMDALDVKEGDVVMAFRDPVWRDGAIRAMTVKKDDSVHGISINPIADKSHDMDFDGDTMGIMKFNSKQANKDLMSLFGHHANMIDHGNGKDELYFQSGMDLASAQAKAEKVGDTSPAALLDKVKEQATSNDPRVLKQALRNMTKYSHKLFREHGFGGDFVSLENDETVFQSFKQMVDNGAKGSASKLQDYMNYHNGKKTDFDAREIQYATGVKSDDTGLAGGFSQKLVSAMRNQDITAALESMYPLTQGTLQIKHDADHAKTVNEILTQDMRTLFRGKNIFEPKRDLMPTQFKEQLTHIMENRMRVDVNEKFIDSVTDVMTDKGKVLPLRDVMAKKGSPMDRVAYGGGYDELNRIADKGESLLEGEQNKLFAPFSMRDADEQTKLAKKDTQFVMQKQALAEAAATVEMAAATQEDSEPEMEDAGLVM